MDTIVGISSSAVGAFHAISLRDGEALRRDGQPVFAVRALDAETVEVLFADGMWMLAHPDDVSSASAS